MSNKKVIGFTGTRFLDGKASGAVQKVLVSHLNSNQWVVGDARGVDSLVRSYGDIYHISLRVFRVPLNPEPWDFANRSLRMVEYLASLDGVLVAFPNKPCPNCCVPCAKPKGGGSGTWLTIAAAKHQGLEIEIHPLTESLILPGWLSQRQLKLF